MGERASSDFDAQHSTQDQPQMEKLALSRPAPATSLGLRRRGPLCACWRASVCKAGIGIYSAVGDRGAV